jgi:parallel beta-helix repeat protein
MYCNESSPTLENCTFANNTSVYYGGGMFCQESSNPTLNNCTFTDNTASWDGGGMYFYIYCFPTLNNCILWNNYALRGSEIYSSTLSSVAVTYSDVKGGWTGTGNIDADPLFVDPVNGDFHLQAGSPCIDTGDPNSPLDPDGTPADIGAFYFDQSTPTLSVTNLVAGQQALVEVHHATPNRYSHFAWSLHGGGPTFTPWGDAMVTAPFHVKIMPTDATGYASYIADVPVSAAGLTVWCHGTDAGTQSMLNALMLVIQ